MSIDQAKPNKAGQGLSPSAGGFSRTAITSVAVTVLAGCATTQLPEIEPVDLQSGTNSIRLEVAGRYSGGFFNLTTTSTPHYDPGTQRLFVPRKDLGHVWALDISDPSKPTRC